MSNTVKIRTVKGETTIEYFKKHLELMKDLGQETNYMEIQNRFVKCNATTVMLQAASIYTKGEGGHWNDKDMIMVMLEVARTSLKILGSDLFEQLSKR